MKELIQRERFRKSKYLVLLIAIFGVVFTPQVKAGVVSAETCATTVDGRSGGSLGVCGVVANCAGLIAASAAAGAAIAAALTAVGTGSFGVQVGNLRAAIQLASWPLILAELRALAAVLNTMPGASGALAYVGAAIAQAQAVITLLGTDMYKNCQQPLLNIADALYGPPERGLPGIVKIPPATCGHEPNGPGRGWTDSCSVCCTKNVDDKNDHCPATRDPARTNCANLVSECTSGCTQYRRDVSNGSRGGSTQISSPPPLTMSPGGSMGSPPSLQNTGGCMYNATSGAFVSNSCPSGKNCVKKGSPGMYYGSCE